MSIDEAEAELNQLYAIAENAVEGEWESDDGGAEACGLPSGGTGARYPLRRIGAGVPAEQQQAVVDAVTSGWTAAGFEPEVTALRSNSGDVFGSTIRFRSPEDGGILMVFNMANTSSDLDGNTRCVPGDAAQINDEYWEQRGE